jgi:hypothetical protein
LMPPLASSPTRKRAPSSFTTKKTSKLIKSSV